MNIKCTVKNVGTSEVRWNIAPGGPLHVQEPGESVVHDVPVVADGSTNIRYIRDEGQDEGTIEVTNDGATSEDIVSKQAVIDTLDPAATKSYDLPPRPDGIRISADWLK